MNGTIKEFNEYSNPLDIKLTIMISQTKHVESFWINFEISCFSKI